MEKDILNLVEGYQKFRETHFTDESTAYAELVRSGQRPKVLMIACSDSRVDPALVMNCQPGELFVVRNVANLVPPYEEDESYYHGTSAALEFGVCTLEIHHLIIFGHTQCGGIQALLQHSPGCGGKSFLTKWMDMAKAAHDATYDHHGDEPLEKQIILCGQYSLVNSLRNLKTFPWIAERVKNGTLSLHAWNFDISRGILEEYDEKENYFKELQLPLPLENSEAEAS